MRARRAALVALTLAAGGQGPVSPAGAEGPTETTFAVPVNGSVTTGFRTSKNLIYEITVSGVYARTVPNLADCGHANTPTSPWTRLGNVSVNGVIAPCASTPVTTTHTYTWSQPGVDGPFTFALTDPSGTAGHLLVQVRFATLGNDHAVVATCHFAFITNRPGSSDLLMVVQAEGHAAGHASPVSTTVYCRVTSSRGDSIEVAGTMAGADAYAAGAAFTVVGGFTVCTRAAATWPDLHEAHYPGLDQAGRPTLHCWFAP